MHKAVINNFSWSQRLWNSSRRVKGRKKNYKEFISAAAEEWTWNPGMSSPALVPRASCLCFSVQVAGCGNAGCCESRCFGSSKQHVMLLWGPASEDSESSAGFSFTSVHRWSKELNETSEQGAESVMKVLWCLCFSSPAIWSKHSWNCTGQGLMPVSLAISATKCRDEK